MNHYEQGLSAYEARRFHEALTHFEKVSSDITPEESTKLAEHIYGCVKVVAPETSWRFLRAYIEKLISAKRWKDILVLLDSEEPMIPELNRDYFLRARADAYFNIGAIENSRIAAIAHVDLLLKKKLYHRLIESAATYQSRFPYVLYFMFLEFEAHLAFANYEKTKVLIEKIIKVCKRKWPKIEDAEHTTKSGLIETLLSALLAEELVSGEAVIQSHFLTLELCLLNRRNPEKEDWKKALEIIVHDDSWTHLKCVLELALMASEEEIARIVYKRLKAKEGYSFVKLTRYEPRLKKWILGTNEVEVQAPIQASVLTVDDLRLDESFQGAQGETKFDEISFDVGDDQELKAIEKNAIKQLELQNISPDLALDLVVTYQTMRFDRVVEWILKQAESFKELPRETQRKFQYLRVIHALGKNQTYLALAVLEEMLGSTDLSIDEYKELKYAQGNVYLRIGDSRSARRCFGEVKKLDPDYRQLAERMTTLEAN